MPVIHDDEPRKKNASRRATWDGSRDSSTVTQLLSSSKGLHGYGSSGGPLISCVSFVLPTKLDSGKLLSRRFNVYKYHTFQIQRQVKHNQPAPHFETKCLL